MVATSLAGTAWGAACVSGTAMSNGATCDLPAGTAVTIEVWGGGGGGGRTNGPDLFGSTPAYTGGAGGGGGYCKYTVTTTAASDTLTATVGAGGRAGTQSNSLTNGEAGGSSSAGYTPGSGSPVTVTANGGSGGELGDLNGTASTNGTGGAGGSGCATGGSFVGYAGGKGGDGVYFTANAGGGGGGSSAGTGTAGSAGGDGIVSNFSNTTYGAGGRAPAGGGAGGAGAGEVASQTSHAAAGSAPGGGGGGGGTSSSDGSLAPSDGAAGRVVVSWSAGINGTCGSSNGSSVSSAPGQNLCAAGSAGSVSGSGPWSWSCAGQNGGTSASCSAGVYIPPPPPPPVDGACGSSLGGTFVSAPGRGLCSAGVASGVRDDGRWRWICAGQNGGVTAQCSAAHAAVDGACGASDGGTFDRAPAGNLCLSGTATAVAGEGPWSWSCAGAFGGESARCAADWGGDTVTAEVTLTVAAPIVQLSRGTGEQALSTLTLRENVGDALSSGTIRIVAPSGVRFTGATYGGIASANAREVATTLSADDTLVVDLTATGAIDTATITPKVTLASNRVSGVLNFDLLDGDLTGGGGIGIAQASGTLGYVGSVEPLTGSAADASLGVGQSTTIQIAGGLGPYTATSSDEGLATVGVTDATATVTGVAAGSPTITLTDALGSSAEVAVEVTSSPYVMQGTPASCPEGQGGGGACLQVAGSITAKATDLGRPGAIYVVAAFPASHGGAVFLLSSTEGWQAYDPAAAKGQYFSTVSSLGVVPVDLGTIPLALLRALAGSQFALGYGRGSVVFGDPWSDMVANETYGVVGTIQEDGSIR
ncbi:hypothetical protein JCM17961_25010 [Endothiovibrio diazotrophicus]